jgi:hypothetical protein
VAYISQDGQNLMALGDANTGTNSLNLCSYSVPDGTYTSYVQAVGKPSITNQMSAAVKFTLSCSPPPPPPVILSLAASPSTLTIGAGGSGQVTIAVTPQSGTFNTQVALACSGLPSGLNCSFSPTAVTPGSSGASSALTVTAAAAISANRHKRGKFIFGSWLLGFGLFGVVFAGRIQRRRMLAMIGTLLVMAFLLVGTSCSGVSSAAAGASSPVNRYVVTINGTAGSVQLSTNVTVTVD